MSTKKPAAKASTKSSKPSGKELTTTTPQQLAIAGDEADLLAADAGSGLEDMSQKDVTIPRLRILQDLSPETKKQKDEFIEGAEAGMFLDTVARTVFDGAEGIVILPWSYRRAFIEWFPRDSRKGKGFVADHGTDESVLKRTTKNDKGQNMTTEGTQIVETAEYFIFLVNVATGEYAPYVISFTGSQLKKSRNWNTVMTQYKIPNPSGPGVVNPPMFYRAWRCTSVPESNDKGSWFGWKIEVETPIFQVQGGKDIYLEARKFREQVKKGQITAAAPADHDDGGYRSEESDSSPM